MRTDAIDSALLRTISEARLKKYLNETRGNVSTAINLYEYNIKLSEAFYTSLQSCEVCLRNSLHDDISNIYGEKWFECGDIPLNDNSRKQVEAARNQLNSSSTPSPGSMVAELKFSFWVGLLGPGYDATLWRKCLYRSFSRGKGRKHVHGRFNAIRRFRNRVFHHEPIFHSNPDEKHHEIIEAIGWICTKTADWTAHNSRVTEVLRTAPTL